MEKAEELMPGGVPYVRNKADAAAKGTREPHCSQASLLICLPLGSPCARRQRGTLCSEAWLQWGSLVPLAAASALFLT